VYYSGDQIENNEMGGACSTNGGEVHTGFWFGNLRERDHLGDPGIDGRINIKMDLWGMDVGAWTGLIWLRIETVGGHC
jgi:hypothetical protein